MGKKKVLFKTTEGLQEIKSRTLGLAPRIRTALLLVDGVKSIPELEKLMNAAGIAPGALRLLMDKGLIRLGDEEDLITLAELETILGESTKLEVDSILDSTNMLESLPISMLAPKAAEKAPNPTAISFPSLALPDKDTITTQKKAIIPAHVLRMNLIAARAHLANALDHFLEIDGYLLKQKVVACESQSELEQLLTVVDGALSQKIGKLATNGLISVTYKLLRR